MKRMFLLVILMLVLLLPLGGDFCAGRNAGSNAKPSASNATKAYLVTGGGEMLEHVTQIQS